MSFRAQRGICPVDYATPIIGTCSATKNLLRSNRLILTRADPSLRSESCREPGGTSRTARSRSFASLRQYGNDRLAVAESRVSGARAAYERSRSWIKVPVLLGW